MKNFKLIVNFRCISPEVREEIDWFYCEWKAFTCKDLGYTLSFSPTRKTEFSATTTDEKYTAKTLRDKIVEDADIKPEEISIICAYTYNNEITSKKIDAADNVQARDSATKKGMFNANSFARLFDAWADDIKNATLDKKPSSVSTDNSGADVDGDDTKDEKIRRLEFENQQQKEKIVELENQLEDVKRGFNEASKTVAALVNKYIG